MKPFKSRKELAKELGISPRTLNRYMKVIGISWGRSPLPSQIWEEVVFQLKCSNTTRGGAKK